MSLLAKAPLLLTLLLSANVAAADTAIPKARCQTVEHYEICSAPHISIPGVVATTVNDLTNQDFYIQITDCRNKSFQTAGEVNMITPRIQQMLSADTCDYYYSSIGLAV